MKINNKKIAELIIELIGDLNNDKSNYCCGVGVVIGLTENFNIELCVNRLQGDEVSRDLVSF